MRGDAKTRALAAAAIVLLLVAAPLALGISAPLRALVTLGGDGLPPAPTLTLVAPLDGQGVGPVARLEGTAMADGSRVTDVQYRLDGARWQSIPDAPRGHAVSAFRVDVPLTPGDHVLEARAGDGEAWSLPARVLVRAAEAAPPTVRIVAPRDGDGLPTGEAEVLGTVSGRGPFRVLVLADGVAHEARVVGEDAHGALWRAVVRLPSGEGVLVAKASGADGEALDRILRVRAGDPAPPTLSVLRPSDGASFGTRSREVVFAGLASGPAGVARVLAQLDEGELAEATLVGDSVGGAWSWTLDVEGLAGGPHRARFTPVAPDGTAGLTREVAFTLRGARDLSIVGEDAPRPTGTPLAFRIADGATATWWLDGEPLGEAAVINVTLPTPGDHALVALVLDEAGRARTARLPLFALNRPPSVVSLLAEAAVAAQPTTLRVEAEDPDGEVALYAWAFGDGRTLTTTEPVATHEYARHGAYDVRVTAYDDAGGASAPYASLVGIANADPFASFRWTPERPGVGEEVRFQDGSADPERRLVSWRWTFDDGAGPVDSREARHVFATRGPHVVTLTVGDEDGGSATRAAIVDVRNVPPIVDFRVEPPFPATAQEVLFVDASTKMDGGIAAWSWDLGDGARAEGPVVRHAYAAPGEYEVALRVTDDWGDVSVRRLVVEVLNAAPLLRDLVVEPEAPLAMQPVRFRVNATDLEGEGVVVEWDLGDGTNASGTDVAHTYAKSGRYEVVALARDLDGQRAVLNLTLLVRPAPPTTTLSLLDGGYAGYPTLLEAAASDADGKVVRYVFDLDGDGLAECYGGERRCAWVFGAPGAHVAKVTVTDDDGLEAAAVLPLEIRPAPGGLSAPTVTIEKPVAGATLGGLYLVEGSATGTAGVALVEAQLRDEAWSLSIPRGGWIPARGTTSWSLLLDTRPFPDGAYSLAIRATDDVGGVNESTVPVVLANGPRASELTLRVLDLREGDVLREERLVRGTAYHPEGATSVRWRVDDGPWRTAEGTPLSWGVRLLPKEIDPGPHVLHVEAYRGVHEHVSARVAFTMADLRPVLVVEQPPTPTLYARLRIEGAATPEARVLWRIDHEVWQDAPASQGRFLVDAPTDAYAGGPHVVSVKAIDERSGLQSEPLTFHVRVLNAKAREAAVLSAAPTTEPREVPWGALALVALAAAATFGRPSRRL